MHKLRPAPIAEVPVMVVMRFARCHPVNTPDATTNPSASVLTQCMEIDGSRDRG